MVEDGLLSILMSKLIQVQAAFSMLIVDNNKLIMKIIIINCLEWDATTCCSDARERAEPVFSQQSTDPLQEEERRLSALERVGTIDHMHPSRLNKHTRACSVLSPNPPKARASVRIDNRRGASRSKKIEKSGKSKF